ncbi:receptor-type tyrosine-protein phosphatase C-like isoform X2 [Limanda limanda]|uniref:receptor-type tyrosine-protein phosphatase C-like isoform X2 n=1 Tax=Limanda limanda TaxID=27771 RepID=UPI0029C8FA43|nr:receptor-type tyrosine-protein phosphatase C-like isoform X2 [Limanda limanda]
MAGLRGVKILLLWAGIIGLAKCQEANGPGQESPVPAKATIASPTTSDGRDASPLTSPEVTTSGSTPPAKATIASPSTSDGKDASPLTSPEDPTSGSTPPAKATTASPKTRDKREASPLTSPEVTTSGSTPPDQEPPVPAKATTASPSTRDRRDASPLISPEVTTSGSTPPGQKPSVSGQMSDEPSQTPPVSGQVSSEPTKAPTASNTTSDRKGPSPLTSSRVTKHNTTSGSTTPVSTSAPKLTCNYTVKPIKFGLQINITSSAVNPVPTSIMINEEGKPQTEAIPSASHSKQSSSHEIKQLKPCTKYQLNVRLGDKDQPTPCQPMAANDSMTYPINEEDIKDADCNSTSSKSVCYQSEWDISSLQTTPDMIPDLQCGNNTVCFKPGSDDICSTMTLTFTSCTNTSFPFNRSITRDFFDVKSINQTAPTKLPAEFETKLPSNCNLSIDYTCRGFPLDDDIFPEGHDHQQHRPEHGRFNKADLGTHRRWIDKFNVAKNLSELEPFTDYRCSGQIKDKNGTVYNTTEVKVRIDCDLKVEFTCTNTTNTSSQLTWTTTSTRCKDMRQNLPKLAYGCSCGYRGHSRNLGWNDKGTVQVLNQPVGGTCKIPDLTPYTDYTCEVQPYYPMGDQPYNPREDRPYYPRVDRLLHPREARSRRTSEVQPYYYYYYAPVGKPVSVQLKTTIGVPVAVTSLTPMVKDHNTITVECHHSKLFYGPYGKFKAQLHYGGSFVEIKHEKCKFEFKDLKYSTNYTVKVIAVNSLFESKPVTSHIYTEYNDKAVIGFLIFLIILTSVALLLVVYKIWAMRRRKSHDLSENMILISTANDEENLMPVEPIAAELLLEAYKRKLADEARLFLAEFQSIPRIFSRHSVKEAKKSSNVPKNRYVDILPYDYNRVQLTTGNGDAGCDYINASFIDGYKEAKKYIAAQGPKDETLGDFWRMVWEQQSSIIVMVTRCEEGNRVKCSQYWPAPDREAEIFEEFVVKLNSEEICPDYTIRHLSLTNKREKSSDREVTHIQFMSWPDHGVPSEPHLLLKLRRRVNAFKNFFSGPIVVHCSAGVGRTGTYIGIDAMMEAMEVEGRVDIYGYMVRLRRQRCLMVQVEAQYILIHQALVEHNQFGETEIPLSEVHSTLSTLTEKTSESEPTLMEEEFERVPTFHKWRTFNTGITEENRGKNSPSSVIPYDYNRVLLKLNEGRSHDSDPEDEEEESSDEEDEESCRYINASHINGYWGPRALIAAQTPLPDTMADFWLMVYQKKVSTLVMLSEENKESDAVYWDKDKKSFGDLEVEVVSTDAMPTFIRRNLMIRHVKKTESRSVKQFQFLKWVNRELPETPQCLADMMKEIKKGDGGSKSQTTVVHCNDGSSRSGVFCALWNLLDCAQTEKVVDVFQVVKTLRKERQSMISSLEQYQFLYDTVQMVFPVQNGEVKAVQASAADSIQIISETAAVEQPDSAASSQQQEAAESTHLVAEEDKEEEPGKESLLMEDTSTVPLDV